MISAPESNTLVLPETGEEIDAILKTGLIYRNSVQHIAIPREKVFLTPCPNKVIFELISKSEINRPTALVRWAKAVRPYTLGATLVSCFSVLSFGHWMGWRPNLPVATASLFGALFVHISYNFFNDFNDHRRLIDFPENKGGSGVIQNGWILPGRLRAAGFIVLGSGLILGIPALFVHFQVLPVIIVISGLCLIGLMIPKTTTLFKIRGVSDGLMFLLNGPLLAIGFCLASFGKMDAGVYFLGTFFGVTSLAILYSKNLRNVLTDRKNGFMSTASALGFTKAKYGVFAIYCLALSVLLAGAISEFLPIEVFWFTFLSLPLLFRIGWRATRASGPQSIFYDFMRHRTFHAHWLLGFLVCLGFFYDGF